VRGELKDASLAGSSSCIALIAVSKSLWETHCLMLMKSMNKLVHAEIFADGNIDVCIKVPPLRLL
jgi:hypothetical protein